ncbi:MAG: hypothetical protein JSS05_00295 [Proteobacteria bacterium]|nr:hypothetical protein [Pseudomonadota bacterium]
MFVRRTASFVFTSSLLIAANAAPVTLHEARFDLPPSCRLAQERAIACLIGGEQFELWVTRKPLAPALASSAAATERAEWLRSTHEEALGHVMQSTFNSTAPSRFERYGKYAALGAALPGNGTRASPAVTFASLIAGDSYWEFLEVVAVRNAATDAVAAALRASLQLPGAEPEPSSAPLGTATDAAAAPRLADTNGTTPAAQAPSPSPERAPDIGASPLSTRFEHARLAFEHPGYLRTRVLREEAGELAVELAPKTRERGGPVITVTLRASAGEPVARQAETLRERAEAAFSGRASAIEFKRFGAIEGSGVALLGMVKPAPKAAAIEALRTLFVGDTEGARLTVELSADQAYGAEAQSAWAQLAGSLRVRR